MEFNIQSKIFFDYNKFEPVLRRWRSDGDVVVFTNGCFDIVHHGHVDSLMQSAKFGTRLVIGLNSDESVHLIKGEGKPVFNVDARAVILAAFAFVDAVVVFEEETPAKLISQIIPDVLVKGEEYKLEEIAGHETVLKHGGRVERLKLVPGISTSELIARIKNLE